jgi:predicted unusual protein kinase regulating ubiquinone biosynthesis (AarF/ABC1/UbiB family)
MAVETDSDTKIVGTDTLKNLGMAGVAAKAVSEVIAETMANDAVNMKALEAPDTADKSFIAFNDENFNRIGVVDEVGLPLVYNKVAIETYWKGQGSALTQRWREFLGYAVPFFTKTIGYTINGGTEEVVKRGPELARDARIAMEKLGPTYIKLGQMMSVRPDVLPDGALDELAKLQDSVEPFSTTVAVAQIEAELGGPLGQFFSEISEEPVAAASLAQVYKARLVSTGEYVALKIQRPAVLETVSKDLYVLRRAAEVFQGLTERFAPQQRTDYVALLNEWAIGFYTELDFLNEAANQMKLDKQMRDENVQGLYIPKVYKELCTRRLLVSEWMDGVKLSEAEPDVINELIPVAQEAFLVQLLQTGFFHADPHPGNILLLSDDAAAEKNAKIALIDFGLVASVSQDDMDTMVSAIIHLANRDYASLVDDFVDLKVLPTDTDRALVIPLMDKALTPYVKGGGAQTYADEVRKQYGMSESLTDSAAMGGFQAMTQDALTVLNDIPFAIPPYFALLGRAIVTLEGIALQGNPRYGIIKEAYPFVSRKLLKEDRPVMQKALQEVLYGKAAPGATGGLQSTRLVVLLNSAIGVVAQDTDSFIDLDSLPTDAISVPKSLKFILSNNSGALREILTKEIVTAADVLLRQSFRKSFELVTSRIESNNPLSAIARLPGLSSVLPQSRFDEIPVPVLLPAVGDSSGTPRAVVISLRDLMEVAAPSLDREQELYGISLVDAVEQVLGKDAATVASGDLFGGETGVAQLLQSFLTPQFKERSLEDLVKTAGFGGLSKGVLSGTLRDSPLQDNIPEVEDTLRSVVVRSLPVLSNVLQTAGVTSDSQSAQGDVDTSEIVDAIADLDPEEAAALEKLVDEVVGGIRLQLEERLSHVK